MLIVQVQDFAIGYFRKTSERLLFPQGNIEGLTRSLRPQAAARNMSYRQIRMVANLWELPLNKNPRFLFL